MRHALASNVGTTEVAVQRAIDILAVLHIQRFIEMKLMANRRERMRVGLRARHRDCGICGDHEGDREGDERGSEQNESAEENPADEIRKHQDSSTPRDESSRRRWIAARSRWRIVAVSFASEATAARSSGRSISSNFSIAASRLRSSSLMDDAGIWRSV